jgi:hypothetical protein
MAARANLHVTAGLQELFKGACDKDTRYVKASIEGEEIVPLGEFSASSDAKSDFDALCSTLEADTPCYFFYRPEMTVKQWVLVAFVPETCGVCEFLFDFFNTVLKVRKRMLFASCRADVRKALGQSNFKAELYANCLVHTFLPRCLSLCFTRKI